MQILKNRAFSIIEILLVIVIIVIFAIFALPQIAKWQEGREVRAEVNSVINYLKEKKSEVDAGKYAMSIVRVGNNNGGAWWTMSNEEWARQMKVPAPAITAQNNLSQYNNKSILNHSRTCPGSYEGYNRFQYSSSILSQHILVKPDLCSHLIIASTSHSSIVNL